MEIALAPPSPADADEFIAAAIDSVSLHGPWLSAPDTGDRFTAFLSRAAREDQASYLIRHTACGGLIGYVNINNIVRGALRSGYLGYAAFRSHAGRGLMTAGLTAVVTDAFSRLGLHRLEANIQPANTLSLNLVRRLGFRREGLSPRYLLIDGQWRDHERWAMLADDWATGDAVRSRG
ncbi:MAG TPA: GNAT family protein [Streptosporangiaceae bacterium]|nr:GNAT family protein [Streptosporangiaceae bacterium]